MNNDEVAVIGLGPAGVSASIYLKRYSLNPICYEKDLIGGKTNYTDKIVNYAGFTLEKGPLLASNYEKQLQEFGIKPIYKAVSKIEKIDDFFRLTIDNQTRDFKYVILAIGLTMKKSNIINIDKFKGRGISTCAICDGNFYKGKDILVYGNGNACLEETLYLASLAKNIYLINPDKKLNGVEAEIEKINKLNNIHFYYESKVVEVDGDNVLKQVKIKNKNEEVIIKGDALFLYGQMLPSSSIIDFDVEKNEAGFIKVDSFMCSSVKNFYVVGDYRDTSLRQVVTASSDGAIASLAIHNDYLKNR